MQFLPSRTVWPAAIVFLTSLPIQACICIFPDILSAVEQADLVFRGKLVKVEYLDPPQNAQHKGQTVAVQRRFLATLEVSGVWKGRVGQTIVLHTRQSSSDCVGFWTEVGKEVLVFANQGGRIPKWTDKVPVGLAIISPAACSLNDEIKDATDTLRKLGPAKPPVSSR